MKWEDRGRSRNLEDRRGRSGSGRGAAVGGGLGLGGLLLVLVISMVTGVDVFALLGLTGAGTGGGSGGGATTRPFEAPVQDASEEELVRFVSFVLDDAQEAWDDLFVRNGLDYEEARLVLYRDAVSSACGTAPAAAGPFYCPLDERIYIDLSFYDVLRSRYGAPGDFAQAYVLAHEVGHHVQNLLGTLDEVRTAQGRDPGSAGELSVAQELQADCFAGVWGHGVAQDERLEAGDFEEGLGAAAAVGDDRLQGRGGGEVDPESFTHGTSEQRMRWFRTGFRGGDPAACDTFTAFR